MSMLWVVTNCDPGILYILMPETALMLDAHSLCQFFFKDGITMLIHSNSTIVL